MKIGEGELDKAVADLEAGKWQSAHEIVQRDDQSPLACWAHGIAHLMEGDEANARYWFRKARRPFAEGSIAEQISALKSAAEDERTKG